MWTLRVLVVERPSIELSSVDIMGWLHAWFRWDGGASLHWRHNEHSGVSNRQPHGCLLNRLFRRRSKKTSKLRITGLCAGNSPGTGEFPAQRASNAENASIWWRHHDGWREDIWPRIILWMHTATEKRSYIVTSSLIGWLHSPNDPCMTLPFPTLKSVCLFN